MGTEQQMTPRSIRIEVPPEPGSVAIARSAVRRVVAFRDDDACSSFLISLTEILSNAIDAHQRIEVDSSVVVTIESGQRDVVVVSDEGGGFDPAPFTALAVPDDAPGAEIRERGRGIALAQAFVPLMAVGSGPAGTRVTLPLDGLGIVR